MTPTPDRISPPVPAMNRVHTAQIGARPGVEIWQDVIVHMAEASGVVAIK